MIRNRFDIRTIQKLHKKMTDQISGLEKHIERLYQNWIIDAPSRVYILEQLDDVLRESITIYEACVNVKDLEYLINTENVNKNFFEKIYDGIDFVKSLNNEIMDPFQDLKTRLLTLIITNGFWCISDFLQLVTNNESYLASIHEINMELFQLYNQVFVPLSANYQPANFTLSSSRNFRKLEIIVSKIESKYDGLIDNSCHLLIVLDDEIEILFEGYIQSTSLNIYSRCSHIYHKYIFKMKRQIKHRLPKIVAINREFLDKYNRYMNSTAYFVHTTDQMIQKIIRDYEFYCKLVNHAHNPQLLSKEFLNTDVKTMYYTINLLLMGDRQCVIQAVVLFGLLKDKKISTDNLSDIIYHNLSLRAQIKLKNNSRSLKTEVERIRKLSYDNGVTIEKKLATNLNMPEIVKAYIIEKLDEIKTGENNHKLQMAINGLMQFPWKPANVKPEFADIKNSMALSRNYLQQVASVLETEIFGHDDSKKVIVELMGKWIQNSESNGQILGLQGPPGVGKTLFAKILGEALGIPSVTIGLGGMNDSADLMGHSFTYAGAQYGMIIRQMIKAGSWRCVMFFDEVDKVAKRNETNEIYHTLIHLTDSNMNKNFQDRFYSSAIEFDLSGVLIVFSYNDSEKLDPILRDRIREIRVSSYSTDEKITIAQRYILKELCGNIGFAREKISIADDVVRYLIEKYTQEAGVRELKRKLEQIVLKLNIDRYYLRGPFCDVLKSKYILKHGQDLPVPDANKSCESISCIKAYVTHHKSAYEEALDANTLDDIYQLKFPEQIEITQDVVHSYLDMPVMNSENIHPQNLVGVINGLYVTTSGLGGIMTIQIYQNYGSKNQNTWLKITGNQKQVMEESVVCAYTIAMKLVNAEIRATIPARFPKGFHIHTPDGATPKDGPSAGCAFATAFVSIFLDKKINHEVAMTGEIQLTGKISQIGGLEAKLAGAKRAGVKRVFICQENLSDYHKILKKNPLFSQDLEVKVVDHILDIVRDPMVLADVDETDFEN